MLEEKLVSEVVINSATTVMPSMNLINSSFLLNDNSHITNHTYHQLIPTSTNNHHHHHHNSNTNVSMLNSSYSQCNPSFNEGTSRSMPTTPTHGPLSSLRNSFNNSNNGLLAAKANDSMTNANSKKFSNYLD
jgi:hypothetical protein